MPRARWEPSGTPPLMGNSYASFVLRRVSPSGDNSLQTRVLSGRPRSEEKGDTRSMHVFT
jgi:hypothetical protein